MPVVQDLADMYKAVDAPATVNLLAKLAVEKSYHAKLDDTRSSLAVSIPAACAGLWPTVFDPACCLSRLLLSLLKGVDVLLTACKLAVVLQPEFCCCGAHACLLPGCNALTSQDAPD